MPQSSDPPSPDDDPLSPEEFDAIYSRVPRVCVDIVLLDGSGAVFLSKRAIEPCKGLWHLPGGTVRYGEALIDAVRRVARRELGIEVQQAHASGHLEYPSHYLHGLGTPVAIVFEVSSYEGQLTLNREAEEWGWFRRLPQDMHADQDTYLGERGYLSTDS